MSAFPSLHLVSTPTIRTAPARSHSWQSAFCERPVERFAAARAIAWEGDPCKDVFLLADGAIRHCRTLLDGRRMIAGFGLPGDLFGLSCLDRYLFTTEAIGECRIRRLPCVRLEGLAASAPHVNASIADELRQQHCLLHARLLALLHKDAEERVADFILDIGRRLIAHLGDGSTFRLAMPRGDIADHLGLTVETVCRAFTRLRRDRIVMLKGRSEVTVADIAALYERAAVDPAGDRRRPEIVPMPARISHHVCLPVGAHP